MSGAPLWCGSYIGIPYSDVDRGRKGTHCWGLVRLVLQERATIDVGDYDIAPSDLISIARTMRGDSGVGPWASVSDPAALDVLLMTGQFSADARIKNAPLHIGVMVSDNLVLHVEQATESVVVPITHHSIRHRVRGFYRHKELAA